jgi:glycosyltransferase involved in cell wall biosynthesis
MKVTLLHFCFEDYTVMLANALCKYVDLTLMHPESITQKYSDVIDPDVKVKHFPKPRIRNLGNLTTMHRMMQMIRDSEPDILHVQETNDPWYDATLLLNKVPPLVTTIHDVFRHPGDRDLIPGSDLTRQIPLFRSQQLIVHGTLQRQKLIERTPRFRHLVNVLSHGELGSLYQERSQGKEQIQREPYTLLFFGRIWPYKGLNYLLKAMPLVWQKIPQAKLIIAGKGERLEQYHPHIYSEQRYEILNRFVAPEEVCSLFQRSTAVILPYTEASHSGVAAIAYGLGAPVIASDVGGLSELIHHGQDGILVEPRNPEALASAIIQLLEDPALQKQYQEVSNRRSQDDLNWSTIALKTVSVYQKTLIETNKHKNYGYN